MTLNDFSGPLGRFWRTVALGAVVMWVVVVADGLNRLGFSGGSDSIRLQVRDLYFEDGLVYQSVSGRGLGSVQARWVASIYRDGVWICGGSGFGTYVGDLVGFTVDDWAGDICDLVPGGNYEGRASWSKVGPDGARRTVGDSFTFVYSLPEVNL